MFVTTNGGGKRAGQAPDWQMLIAAAANKVRPPVVAQGLIRSLRGGSHAHLFKCDDDRCYAVKFRGNPHGNGRGIFNEQVVALIGKLIGAPVPEVRRVTVTAEPLASLRIDLGGRPAEPGLQHGSCWAEGFSEKQDLFQYPGRNREAFATLQLLYSLLVCIADYQVIYRNTEPYDVLSVDHALFLPWATGWTAQGLRGFGDSVSLDTAFGPLGLTAGEYAPALDRLAAISLEQIAEVAATPPAEWEISGDDRVAFAEFVQRRRIKLLESFCR